MSTSFKDTQWESAGTVSGKAPTLDEWIPEDERARILAYLKYDDMYWNNPSQYALRVLDGENPLYIPNPRIVVDTTAHFLLKGLKLTCQDKKTSEKLENFLKRETFYSRFSEAKRAGVARGDFVFHLTANPNKEAGSRLSLNSVPALDVYPIWDTEMPGRMVGAVIATPWQEYIAEEDRTRNLVRQLKYTLVEGNPDMPGESRRVYREEALYEYDPSMITKDKLKLVRQIIPYGALDEQIQHIPIYWFKNRHWDGEDYGSSELRGIERLAETISQGATDVSASLALEGLGVYATDGGRPVMEAADGSLQESDWEISPGKVIELPTGAKFIRVQGVGSVTPAQDNIKYLEDKVNTAMGLSDVALGNVDAQVADSGIALAIKFLPTLAKIEDRDQAGLDKLSQMFYDWKTWYGVFEHEELSGDIIPTIGEKLPLNRASQINELNNMYDRKVISKAYYRSEMEKLGYEFPKDIEEEMLEEIQRENQARTFVSPTEHQNGIDNEGIPNDPKTSQGGLDAKPNPNGDTLPVTNRSNNKNRPNESAGTETKAD